MSTLKGSIIITGANGGLGTAFVTNLLSSPQASDYRGIYTVRNPETAHDLQKVLSTAPKTHQAEVLALNLSSLASVRAVAADLNGRVSSGALEPIRAVVLNAAFQESNEKVLTAQTFTDEGFEAAFGINYLANFLFVLLILKSLDKDHGRIVMVSSFTHNSLDPRNDGQKVYSGDEFKEMYTDTESLSKGIVYKDDGNAAGVSAGYRAGMRRYGASKLLLLFFMCVPSRNPHIHNHTDILQVRTPAAHLPGPHSLQDLSPERRPRRHGSDRVDQKLASAHQVHNPMAAPSL